MTNKRVEEGFLAGVRVIEVADELGEYCGKVLAGLGADVIKVEPPEGESTRLIGPFKDDVEDPEHSLHYWHYNVGKRSVVIELDDPAGADSLRDLLRTADVLLDTRPPSYLADRVPGWAELMQADRGLIHARISPFGDDGPWAGFRGSDLVHLALGGVMMNCGYDARPDGRYDTPPIAPAMWQSYQIAGEVTAIAIIGALTYRLKTGHGQALSTSVHDAVSKNTETDLPDWIYMRQAHVRQTCRHSMPTGNAPSLAMTKDGRWLLPYRTYLPGFVDVWAGTLRLLQKQGMQIDLDDPHYLDPEVRESIAARMHMADASDKMVLKFKYDRDIWLDAQAEGLPWAPIRRPEENLSDPHWAARSTYVEIEHPELGQTYSYVGAKWHCPEVPWAIGTRPPLLGEHTREVLSETDRPGPRGLAIEVHPRGVGAPQSPFGKPWALDDVRIVDLSWLLASAGSGRFFTALGAEVIKVEHESRWDAMRWGTGMAPPGGRDQREAATGPIDVPPHESPNRGGAFMEINAGKLGASLNLKSERGKELLTELLRDADVVVEGFSPGTMERMGFGYDRLREINPRIIYVQQSGMGQAGTYGSLRSYGPTAQAFSGLSEMSGLAEPYPPAGIGYSYLDWFGAYNMALAVMAALYRQRTTGQGCYIDASQVETGIFLTGTATLDWSVNGRRWRRHGNSSPYKPAAPSGAYRCAGEDRWIAISCFDDAQWSALVRLLGDPAWAQDQRFATLASRQQHAAVLDELVDEACSGRDAWELMSALQGVGVPAGVCQTAQDRVELDPQLRHLEWLLELEQSEIGIWPVKNVPVQWSLTPPHVGGVLGRSGPSYAEDNDYVYRTLLGLSEDDVKKLEVDGVI